MNSLTNEQFTVLAVIAIISITIIIQFIVQAIATAKKQQSQIIADPIAQRIQAIEEVAKSTYLSSTQVEKLIKQVLDNQSNEDKEQNNEKSGT